MEINGGNVVEIVIKSFKSWVGEDENDGACRRSDLSLFQPCTLVLGTSYLVFAVG